MRVLITGGSEGIGYAFAQYYCQNGHDVILASKRKEKLADAKRKLKEETGMDVTGITCDLSKDQAAQALYEQAGGDDIDVLINCAGFGTTGYSWHIPVDRDEDLVKVNDIALMTLCKLFTAGHVKKKHGTVINVASTGAFQPGPYIASYYASKAFVMSYTRALHEEVKPFGIRVYCLCPGPVDTAFYAKSGGTMSGYHMSAQDTVTYCMNHLKKQCVIVPGMGNRLMRYIPEVLRIVFLRKAKKPKGEET
ncbi:MAG: SDR family NAD(P)-dependent oxidoreductase [Bulleidia sp.]